MIQWLLIAVHLFVPYQMMVNQKPLSFSAEMFLDTFFRELFETTTSGYVLYGIKPVSVENYLDPMQEIPGTKEHYFSVQQKLAKQILAPLIQKPQKYIIYFSDHETLVINREKFFRAINENLLLFQYKFGIGITAEQLLENLLNHNFQSLFQESTALQGILLGYGPQNALTYEKGMLLRKSLFSDQNYGLPYRFPVTPKTEEDLLKKMEESPLWKEMKAEVEDLSYHQNSDNTQLKIPFSFHKNSLETKTLFEEYSKSQKNVESILKTKNFTKQVMNRLGGELPKSLELRLTEEEQAQLPRIVARSILDSFPEEFSSSFVEGMCAAVAGKHLEEAKEIKFLEVLRRNFSDLNATRSLRSIEQERNITSLIPQKLLCRVLKEGDSEQTFNFHFKNIEINLLIEDLKGNILGGNYHMAPPLEIQVHELLPAIAHGMLGMKIGEIRELYIHPQLVYGVESKEVIKVKIQLLNFGECATLEEPMLLKPVDTFHISPDIASCTEYSDLQDKYFHRCGLRTWAHYQPLVPLDAVLTEIKKNPASLSEIEKNTLLKLEWLLYTQNGRSPSAKNLFFAAAPSALHQPQAGLGLSRFLSYQPRIRRANP